MSILEKYDRVLFLVQTCSHVTLQVNHVAGGFTRVVVPLIALIVEAGGAKPRNGVDVNDDFDVFCKKVGSPRVWADGFGDRRLGSEGFDLPLLGYEGRIVRVEEVSATAVCSLGDSS